MSRASGAPRCRYSVHGPVFAAAPQQRCTPPPAPEIHVHMLHVPCHPQMCVRICPTQDHRTPLPSSDDQHVPDKRSNSFTLELLSGGHAKIQSKQQSDIERENRLWRFEWMLCGQHRPIRALIAPPSRKSASVPSIRISSPACAPFTTPAPPSHRRSTGTYPTPQKLKQLCFCGAVIQTTSQESSQT